ncbi:unconventional prefoldin RPB5 interactor [Trichonephila inaurata madagascariensis]|uniref:Unconventional prefoldin RPB5 interactor n=1 Tax=Trichonephila inaurata madagascariensis TaxID=2747483 RepID=A0A8X6ILQ6_9ARAC|nr:unconventional prefoldin RPB5 interactor [Trichonephila inaurata madagascariensis]
MDPTQVKRLKEEQGKALQACIEKIAQWEKFKADYEALKQQLQTLPDAVSYDITVPFGSNAFTMGKMVHTNEVMVLLGDNWFAEVSAKQAAVIAERRIKHCVKMLEDLEKEKVQYHNWMNYIDEVSVNEGLIEIVEKYDDEQEQKWREQHAKNMKAYRQQLAKERKNSGESTSDDDYLNDTSQHSEESSKSLKLKINANRKASFESETEESPQTVEQCDELSNGKHVRWQDLSKQNMKKITFKHSKSKKSPPVKCQSPIRAEEQPLIQSPSDIYKQFGSFFPASPPKSILKVKHSPTPENEEPFFVPENNKEENINTAFTGEVCEHSSPVHITEKKSSRPVSHFKSSRKNRKRRDSS